MPVNFASSDTAMDQQSVETLIIIPARSGSKGVEHKNIRLLGGKPLLAWTIETALGANIERSITIVSTDSIQYAEIARQYGAQVPFLRPAQYASDKSTALDVVTHALDWFERDRGQRPLQVMWLQPTSPFRSVDNIRVAMRMLIEKQADSVIACKTIERDLTALFKLNPAGFMQAIDLNKQTQTRRQDIDALLTPNGALYLAKTEMLLRRNSFYGDKTLSLVMNAIQSLDIDNEEDWAIAEAFIKQGLV